MLFIREPRIELIASTGFERPKWTEGIWNVDMGESPHALLIEFSGRNCYQSWNNPGGKTTQEYIDNIIEQGHLSVLEHASASFHIAGVSRSLTHELVRHRHLSFSQESQRYVDARDIKFIIPPAILGDEALELQFMGSCISAHGKYVSMLNELETKYAAIENARERKKATREAARSLLPNAAETQIVVTGNLRAWRWFLHMRGTRAAEREIRRLAAELWEELVFYFPEVFADFNRVTDSDGIEHLEHKYPY